LIGQRESAKEENTQINAAAGSSSQSTWKNKRNCDYSRDTFFLWIESFAICLIFYLF
jgi:hypothetical protein